MNYITVIMSTYNGEKYLVEQLESILNQDIKGLHIYIRDDGSTDSTKSIIKKYAVNSNVTYSFEKNIGAKNSFMDAINNAPKSYFYALADQDDIWEYNKLSSALEKMSKFDAKKPILYHSSLYLADENGKIYSQVGKYNNYGFLNGENRAVTGCTVVFNDSLMNLLKLHKPRHFPMHDAWIHNLCLAINGTIIYDTNSYIRYRQHSNNVVGGKKGKISSIRRRLKYLKHMESKQTSNMYFEILSNYSSYMDEQNIKRIQKVINYDKSLGNKIKLLFDNSYFKGRLWWIIEKKYLIIFNKL